MGWNHLLGVCPLHVAVLSRADCWMDQYRDGRFGLGYDIMLLRTRVGIGLRR
jgi:hypothetical protein